MYVEDKNMNMIIEARSTHVYRGGGPNHKEDMSRLCAMEVKIHEALGNLSANEGNSITKVKEWGSQS